MMHLFKPNRQLTAWLALLVLALAACAPAAGPAAIQPQVEMAATVVPSEPPAQAAPTEQAAPTIQAATQPPAAATPTGLPAAAVAPAQPAISPAISNEFTPSDPAQVSLAAGRPQFVEFFAFW